MDDDESLPFGDAVVKLAPCFGGLAKARKVIFHDICLYPEHRTINAPPPLIEGVLVPDLGSDLWFRMLNRRLADLLETDPSGHFLASQSLRGWLDGGGASISWERLQYLAERHQKLVPRDAVVNAYMDTSWTVHQALAWAAARDYSRVVAAKEIFEFATDSESARNAMVELSYCFIGWLQVEAARICKIHPHHDGHEPWETCNCLAKMYQEIVVMAGGFDKRPPAAVFKPMEGIFALGPDQDDSQILLAPNEVLNRWPALETTAIVVPHTDAERREWMASQRRVSADKALLRYRKDPRQSRIKREEFRVEWAEVHGTIRGRPADSKR